MEAKTKSEHLLALKGNILLNNKNLYYLQDCYFNRVIILLYICELIKYNGMKRVERIISTKRLQINYSYSDEINTTYSGKSHGCYMRFNRLAR